MNTQKDVPTKPLTDKSSSDHYTFTLSRRLLLVLGGTLLILAVSLGSFGAGYFFHEYQDKLSIFGAAALKSLLASKSEQESLSFNEKKSSLESEESWLPDFSEVFPENKTVEQSSWQVLRGVVQSASSEGFTLRTSQGEVSLRIDEKTKLNSGSKEVSIENLVTGKRVVVIAEPLDGKQFLAKRLIVIPDIVPQGI